VLSIHCLLISPVPNSCDTMSTLRRKWSGAVEGNAKKNRRIRCQNTPHFVVRFSYYYRGHNNTKDGRLENDAKTRLKRIITCSIIWRIVKGNWDDRTIRGCLMGAMSPIHIEPPRAAKSPRNTPMSTASGLPAIASHAVTAASRYSGARGSEG
jgi:hypothetical protein